MPNRKSIQLPPFTETGVILAIFCCIALVFVPEIRRVLAEAGEGPPLPAMTRMVFIMSPGGIIFIALILGIGAGLGGLIPENRRVQKIAVILTILFACMILAGLALPFLHQ